MNKALLIGINRYPPPAEKLEGCINDIRDMAELLRSNYGFEETDMGLICDGAATSAAISGALSELMAGVSSGDRVLFYYSGHGTQMLGQNGEVVDAICPVDFDFDVPTLEHAITAKDFARIFAVIPQGVEFNWLSDSCCSGNLTRALLRRGARSKFLRPPPAIQAEIDRRLRAPQPRLSRFENACPLNGGFISACGPTETSWDAVFPTASGDRANGAFTYFALRELKRTPYAVLTTLCLAITEELHRGRTKFKQSPEVKGSSQIISRPFLGGYPGA
jgi:hypothetical protein